MAKILELRQTTNQLNSIQFNSSHACHAKLSYLSPPWSINWEITCLNLCNHWMLDFSPKYVAKFKENWLRKCLIKSKDFNT